MQENTSIGERIRSIAIWVIVSLCALVGIGAVTAAICIATVCHDADPILLDEPEEATVMLTAMLDSVRDGDFTTATQYILGQPSLDADNAPEDALALLLWNTWKSSMSYELNGDCHTSQAGLAQDVTISYIDINSITGHLREDAEKLMEQRIAEAEDVSEIYDENNEYREDFITEVLCEAAETVIEKYSSTTSVSITINMTYQDGQWWVLAEEALLYAISGGILYR